MKERERRRKGNVTDIKGIQIDRQKERAKKKEPNRECMYVSDRERERQKDNLIERGREMERKMYV